MKKFVKKPVEVEAMLISEENREQLESLDGISIIYLYDSMAGIKVQTLEGEMYGNMGFYLIRGVKGELCPCRPDIFKATYEPVDV